MGRILRLSVPAPVSENQRKRQCSCGTNNLIETTFNWINEQKQSVVTVNVKVTLCVSGEMSWLCFNKGVCMCLSRPTERERTERLIKTRLREIMMQKDLENVTCKEVRGKHTRIKITSRFWVKRKVNLILSFPTDLELNQESEASLCF